MPPLKRKRDPSGAGVEGSSVRRATRQTSIAPITPTELIVRRRPGRQPIANGKENIPMPHPGEPEPNALKPDRHERRSDLGPNATKRRRIATLESGRMAGDGGLGDGAVGHVDARPSARGAGSNRMNEKSSSLKATRYPPVPAPPTVPYKPAHRLSQGAGPDRPRNERIDRNIDKIVLGNICFPAWYPSYYGKDVLGEGAKGAKGSANGDVKDEGSVKTNGRKEREKMPILDRLYVCPCCFKYSKELVTWWEHVRVCEREGRTPGRKIYVHPKGRRTVLVPSLEKQARGKRGNSGSKIVKEEIQDEGEWSIWEVKGDNDVLFCQNLSLFAKLFLDNKSVFFDVTGFNYFLLVHTPPAPRSLEGADSPDTIPPRTHIVGFFSKEKMSWDSNNLACILIFPPWQRKGLGSLLIGISYEISRREGVIGGPEKPISDMGKKGYKRFWACEIARWLLQLDVSNSPEAQATATIEECSRSTWIAVEDCLAVLREMNLAHDAGKGAPKVQALSDTDEELESVGDGVQMVRIDKKAIRAWVQANGISLERVCDPEGFVDGYFSTDTPTPSN